MTILHVKNHAVWKTLVLVAFLINTGVAGAYSIFLIYVETLACLYFRHCIKTGDIDMFLETAAKMATPLVT